MMCICEWYVSVNNLYVCVCKLCVCECVHVCIFMCASVGASVGFCVEQRENNLGL